MRWKTRRAARAAAMMAVLCAWTAACRQPEAPHVLATGAAPAAGFRDVVQAVLPSIVFIQVEATPPAGLARAIPQLRQLPDGPIPIGAGSGVLFTEDGYILTNNHVVQDAERVLVVLHDRRWFEAEVVGRDPSTEVAVVRIRGRGLPAARLADSDDVALGDWVLALGSPLGLQFSVTAGIVSGTGRAIGILGAQPDQAAAIEHFIQTDAALSPGNSGGPLLNGAGEVVGINTAVAAPRGAPGGYGFAIPINIARNVARQLIETGEVRRAFIGAVLSNVSPVFAQEHGLATLEGAVVMGVQAGGPAERAGVQQGDVITAIDGAAVRVVSDLQVRLTELQPGTTATLRLQRQGRPLEARVELGLIRSGVGGG